MNEYIESVIQLSRYLHLFPCYGIVDGRCECGVEQDSSIGKHPRFGSYVDHATQDEEQIRAWLNTWPNTNFAAHCEKSGIFVLDTDPRSGGHTSRARLDDLTEGAIPRTVKAITGRHVDRTHAHRGFHEYFVLPEGLKLPANLSKLGLPGLDIKANGYVIVPPSRHHSGVSYEWAEGLAPHEIKIADAPAEFWDVVLPKRRKSASVASTGTRLTESAGGSEATLIPVDEAPEDDWQRARAEEFPITRYGLKAMQGICDDVYSAPEGERNTALNRAAFRTGYLIALRHISYTESAKYLAIAARQAPNPLLEDEISGVLAPDGRGFEDGYHRARKEQREADARKQHETANESVLDRLNLVNWAELFAGGEVEEPWLVEGLISRERQHVIYSDAGLGKSLLAREIAVKLATGKPVLGLPASTPVRVLYLDNENIIRGDVLRSLQDMGVTPDELDNLFFAAFPDIPSLNTMDGTDVLSRILDEIQPDLVILDTASRFVQGDENSNDTWNALYNHLGKLLKTRGIALIRLDHEGKSGAKGQRGGSAKKGDVDLVWHMERSSSENLLTFTLTNEKARIPLPYAVRTLDRFLNPLRHVLRDPHAFDWVELLAKAEGYSRRMDQREATVEAFYEWVMAQPKGVETGRDAAFKGFSKFRSDSGLTCGVVSKKDAEVLLKKFRGGSSVAEVMEDEFPQTDPSQWEEAA